MRILARIAILALFFLKINTSFAVTTNTSSVDSIFAFSRISQVLAAPDGKHIAFSSFTVNPNAVKKAWEYSLYLSSGKDKPYLLIKNERIEALSWLPDNKSIAYLAKGNNFKSIWIVDIKSKKTNKLIEFSSDIQSFKFSPNGKYIAFVAAVEKEKLNTTLIDFGQNYINQGLYLVPADQLYTKPILLSSAQQSISLGFFDKGFDWSPDSQRIAFSYQPQAGAEYANDSKIHLINIATHEIKNIPYTDAHTGKQVVFSPDGKWIAFRSNVSPTKIAPELNNNLLVNGRICVVNTESFNSFCLSNTPNENPYIIGWGQYSDKIFVLDAYQTSGYQIYELGLNQTSIVRKISNVDGFIEPLTVSLNDAHTVLGFGYETALNTPQAYISELTPFKLIQVSDFQNISNLQLGNTKNISWKSFDNKIIDGLLLTPHNYDPTKKYPLLVTVHGGPYGVWSKRYIGGCDEYQEMIDPTTCWQSFLNLGFVILEPNPRGSTGYGKAFRMANFKDFGGGDYRDVMAGVDYLIQQNIVDSNHMAIAGWSYGGYMTTWAISQTNRFKAAVEGAGNIDLIAYASLSDVPWFIPMYLGATFWNNNTLYLERAPILLTKNIQTPLLIMHGANDIRDPISLSYELYNTLKQQNKSVKMVVLPDSEHVPTKADVIYDGINEVNHWLMKTF